MALGFHTGVIPFGSGKKGVIFDNGKFYNGHNIGNGIVFTSDPHGNDIVLDTTDKVLSLTRKSASYVDGNMISGSINFADYSSLEADVEHGSSRTVWTLDLSTITATGYIGLYRSSDSGGEYFLIGAYNTDNGNISTATRYTNTRQYFSANQVVKIYSIKLIS